VVVFFLVGTAVANASRPLHPALDTISVDGKHDSVVLAPSLETIPLHANRVASDLAVHLAALDGRRRVANAKEPHRNELHQLTAEAGFDYAEVLQQGFAVVVNKLCCVNELGGCG